MSRGAFKWFKEGSMIKSILKLVVAVVSLVGVALISYALGVASGRDQTVQVFLDSLCLK